MTTYKEIFGKYVKNYSSDPSSDAEGQVWYNTTSGTFKSVLAADAWSAGGNLATARYGLAGAGTQNAGLAVGGYLPPNLSCTEEYNGTSWSAGGALGTARYALAGAGTQAAGLAFGGYPGEACTEEYNPSTIFTAKKTFDYSSTTGNVSLRVESQQTTLNNSSGSLGQLSVSGSSLYFHNGSIWKLVTLT